MTRTNTSRRAQIASAVNRQSTRRDRDEQRKEIERRMRRVAGWLRSYRSR
jgi:hypothetical protein